VLDAFPSGSYLAISSPTGEVDTEAMNEVIRRWNESGATPAVLRSAAGLARFFADIELLEPGIVSLPAWRPEPGTRYTDREIGFFCGVGRKP
jgi:hypothetical protein